MTPLLRCHLFPIRARHQAGSDSGPDRPKAGSARTGKCNRPFLLQSKARPEYRDKKRRFVRSVSRTFDRDVGAAGKLRTVNVRYHDAEMLNPPASDTTNELPCSSAERRPTVKSTRGRLGRARLRRAAEPFEALLIGFIRVISG